MKPFVSDISAKATHSYLPILTGDNAINMKSGMVTLQPNEAVGEHNTYEKEELIIVLQGKATIEMNGSVHSEVKAGSVAYIPNRTQHNVLNRTRFKLRYIYVTSLAE